MKFVWLDNEGLEFELKCTKMRVGTITAAISQAFYKAKCQGVVKENFIVFLGDVALSGEARAALTRFNMGRIDPLAQLWVMSATGLEQIALTT